MTLAPAEAVKNIKNAAENKLPFLYRKNKKNHINT